MLENELVLVTGAGGFIGGALVADFRRRGFTRIRAVDIKPLNEWYQSFPDVDNLVLDLNLRESCQRAAAGAHQVFNLAANMGGMGFIESNKALCMLSVLINTHMLQAARELNLDLPGAWLIGDSTTDVETARNAGVKSMLVRTGHGGQDGKYPGKPDFVAENVLDAVNLILARTKL